MIMFTPANIFNSDCNQYLDDPIDADIQDHDTLLWCRDHGLHELQDNQPAISTRIINKLDAALRMGKHARWQTPVCRGLGTTKGFFCSRPHWEWSIHSVGNGDIIMRAHVRDALNYMGEWEQAFCWRRTGWDENLLPVLLAAFDQTTASARQDYTSDVIYYPIRFVNEENILITLTALLPNDIMNYSQYRLGEEIPRHHQITATHAPRYFGWQECNTMNGKQDAVFSVCADTDAGFDIECNGWQSELPSHNIHHLYQEEAADLLRMAELMISELSMPSSYSSARSYRGWKIYNDVV
jgi:hypothetical protein